MYDSYLEHHGIKGMKWGVRRFRNEDGSLTETGKKRYSDEQYNRDVSMYGRGGAKRIRKRVEEQGVSVSGARSEEARRIHAARRKAKVYGQIGESAGDVGGLVGGAFAGWRLSRKVDQLIDDYGELSYGERLAVDASVSAAVAKGSSSVGKTLGRYGGQAIGMITSGYSPTRYRNE